MVLILPINKSLYSPLTSSHCGARADVEDVLMFPQESLYWINYVCVQKVQNLNFTADATKFNRTANTLATFHSAFPKKICEARAS